LFTCNYKLEAPEKSNNGGEVTPSPDLKQTLLWVQKFLLILRISICL
jgi:hypothetical protein